MVENELKYTKTYNSKYSNTTWANIKALEKRKEVVVCPADKGGCLVILSKENYYKELNRLVEDHTTYEKYKKSTQTTNSEQDGIQVPDTRCTKTAGHLLGV